MKRIIDGKTYNTDTSTLIARDLWAGNGEFQEELYLTRGGSFFTVVSEPYNPDAPPAMFTPKTKEEAGQFIQDGTDLELYDTSIFAEPPEAAEEEGEPEATLYIRVPRSLKDICEARAKEAGLSLNSWVLRCVEGYRAVAEGWPSPPRSK